MFIFLWSESNFIYFLFFYSFRIDPSWSDPDWQSELIRSDFCTCLFLKYCFDKLFINLAMQILILSTSCDIISFLKIKNSQGQLCHLTCARWRELWNHTRVSTIKSRRQKNKAKKPKPSNIDSKLPMNLVPLFYLPTSPFIWS